LTIWGSWSPYDSPDAACAIPVTKRYCDRTRKQDAKNWEAMKACSAFRPLSLRHQREKISSVTIMSVAVVPDAAAKPKPH